MKSSKAQIHAKFHKIPTNHFEDQKLTSFSGLFIFQALLRHINLKKSLKKCFSHIKISPIFGHHCIVLLLIVHLLIGFRRLREVDYYRDDPIVLRLLRLRKLPDTSTISHALSQIDAEGLDNYRRLSRELDSAYLGHIPIRDPWQYGVKAALKYFQYLAMFDKESNWGWQY